MKPEWNDIDLPEELQEQLLAGWEAALPRRYPLEPEQPHDFSRDFSRRMDNLCRQARRRRFPWRRRLALVAAALVLAATVAMASPGFQGLGYREMMNDTADGLHLGFRRVPEGYNPGDFLPYRISGSFLPDGFTQTSRTSTPTSWEEVWSHGDGRTIRYRQTRLDKADFDLEGIRDQGADIVLYNSFCAWILTQGNSTTLTWDDGEYAFLITGDLTREEATFLTKSLTLVDPPDYTLPFQSYRLTWVPEGFWMYLYFQDDSDRFYAWRNQEMENISLDQLRSDQYDYVLAPEAQVQQLLLKNGSKAWFIEDSAQKELIWQQDSYQFILSFGFRTDWTGTREDLLRMANSVELAPEGIEETYPGPFQEEEITAMPEDFTLVRRWITTTALEEKWESPDRGALLFQKTNSGAGRIDGRVDRTRGRPVTMGENWPGWYREEGEDHILYWEGYGGFYGYRITSRLSMEEMIALADSTEVALRQVPLSDYTPDPLPLCMPGYLPADFVLEENGSDEEYRWASWRRGEEELTFEVVVQPTGSPDYTDINHYYADGSEWESNNEVEGLEDSMYRRYEGIDTLSWGVNNYYRLMLRGTLPRTEMERIAKSVPPPGDWYPEGEWGAAPGEGRSLYSPAQMSQGVQDAKVFLFQHPEIEYYRVFQREDQVVMAVCKESPLLTGFVGSYHLPGIYRVQVCPDGPPPREG